MKDITSHQDLPAKRPSENSSDRGDDSKSKRMKEDKEEAQNHDHNDEKTRDNQKKPLFRRLSRSDEDEAHSESVAAINVFLNNITKNDDYKNANQSGLLHFIESLLKVSDYPQQLKDRLSEMKEKLRPQHQEAFDKENKTGSRVGEELDLAMYPSLKESLRFGKNVNALAPALGKNTLQASLRLIGNTKLKELDDQWRKLQEEELELFMKRMDLIMMQTRLVHEAIKSSSVD